MARSSRTRRAWASPAVVAALLLATLAALPIASAFTLLTTDTGAPRVWHRAELRYRTIYDAAAPEPAASEGAELGKRLDAAIQPWSSVVCDKEGTKVSVGVSFKSTAGDAVVRCDDTADPTSKCAGGDGVIRVVADEAAWPHSKLTVGYTLLLSDSSSGESIRFVLLLNDASYDFCDTSCDGPAFDIRTVVLHEAGHVLGLDHSSNNAAVMADARSAGEILRVLSADDIAGMCEVYPAKNATVDDGGLCSARSTGRPAPLFALLALAVMVIMARSRVMTRSRRRMVPVPFVALLAFAAPLLPAQAARAFTLAVSSSGAHLRWSSAEIGWDLDETGLGAQGLNKDVIELAVSAAFDNWEAVQCELCHDSCGVSCPPVACSSHPLGIGFRFDGWGPPRPPGLGCVANDKGVPCTGKPDGNQVLFVHDKDAWLVGSHVVALTLVAADQQTGVIGDADILLNAADKLFCVAPDCGSIRYDLANTLAHEIGHVLGLEHSLDSSATMYGGSPPGEISKRDLADDDIVGVCTAYRMIWTVEGCPAVVSPGGCSVARTSTSSVAAALVLAVAMLAMAVFRGVWA
jgi:predicted Zn-dependent protease